MLRSHRLACALVCLMLPVITACAEETPQPGTTGQPAPGTAAQVAPDATMAAGSTGLEGPAAGTAARSAGGPSARLGDGLSGRLITIGITNQAPDGKEGQRNLVSAVDLATRRTRALWATDPGDHRASAWSVSPDGRRLAFRVVQPMSVPGEAIVVRSLVTDAPVTLAVALDPQQANVAGLVWAPGSGGLAYGLHVRTPITGTGYSRDPMGRPVGWELHTVTVPAESGAGMTPGPDVKVWEAPVEAIGDGQLVLVGWDPASGRAALAELPQNGGDVVGFLLVDTERQTLVGRVAAATRLLEIVPAMDGRMVAFPVADGSVEQIAVLGLKDGKIAYLDKLDGYRATGLTWSSDAARLGWIWEPASGEGDRAAIAEIGDVEAVDGRVQLANAQRSDLSQARGWVIGMGRDTVRWLVAQGEGSAVGGSAVAVVGGSAGGDESPGAGESSGGSGESSRGSAEPSSADAEASRVGTEDLGIRIPEGTLKAVWVPEAP